MITKRFGSVLVRRLTVDELYRAVNSLSFKDFEELVALGELTVCPSKSSLQKLAFKLGTSSPEVWGLFKVDGDPMYPCPLMFGGVSFKGNVWMLSTARESKLKIRQLVDIVKALKECKRLSTKNFETVSNIVYCNNSTHVRLLSLLGVKFGEKFAINNDGDMFQFFSITRDKEV